MTETNNQKSNISFPQKQRKISKRSIQNLLPYQFKKGQSGNPGGRPKGPSMKVWVQNMLLEMTEEERQEFLNGIPKETIWKMSEGNPKNDVELSGEIKSKVVKLDE